MAETPRRSEPQERRRADEQRRHDRIRSDKRFKQVLRDFRQDRARREAQWRKLYGKPCRLLILIEKALAYATRVERAGRKRAR
jgi:hypothetical protein